MTDGFILWVEVVVLMQDEEFGFGEKFKSEVEVHEINSPQRLEPWDIKCVSEHTAPRILLVSENAGPNFSKFLNP